MPGCCFESRGDAEQRRFVKRTCNEVDAHGQIRLERAHQSRAVTAIAHAVPNLCRKACRHGNRGETLLPDERPADRQAAICIRFARRRELSWRDG